MATLLEQLKGMTTIVADTGDVEAIKTVKPYDATTNPSLLLKASTLPQCEPMIKEAIAYAKSKSSNKAQQVEDAADKLDQWHRIDELRTMVEFVVISRPGYVGNGIDIGALPVAATTIREGLSADVSSSVAAFIRENNLYDN